MNQESKVKARTTKLAKKSKDDLIAIILKKDKECNSLKSKNNSHVEKIAQLKEEVKFNTQTINAKVFDVHSYINTIDSLKYKLTTYKLVSLLLGISLLLSLLYIIVK